MEVNLWGKILKTGTAGQRTQTFAIFIDLLNYPNDIEVVPFKFQYKLHGPVFSCLCQHRVLLNFWIFANLIRKNGFSECI